MNSDTSNQLDRLLRRWAEQRASAHDQLNPLRKRIVQSILDDPAGDTSQLDDRMSFQRSRTRRLTMVCCGIVIAATVLGALHLSGLLQPGDADGRRTVAQTDSPPECAWLQEGHLRDQAMLLKEMESVFDGKVTWLLETNEDVTIGLAEREANAGAQPVTIRVVLQTRHPGQTNWTNAWTADVVTRSEDVVRFEPESPSGNRLTIWSYVLPDGMIAVDADLTLNESTPVRLATSGLQEDRTPVVIQSTVAGDCEFRLFQTAAVLDGSVI